MQTQLDIYKARQAELVREYNGKIIALKDGEVQGVFPSKTEALEFMRQRFAPGSFLIIKCTPGDEEYTQWRRKSAMARAPDRPLTPSPPAVKQRPAPWPAWAVPSARTPWRYSPPHWARLPGACR